MINSKKLNSPFAQLIKNEPALMSALKDGDLIEARLLKKANRQVYFDLGPSGTGVVFGVELANAQTIIKNLNIGDSVSAKIVDLENEDGYVEISLSEAGKQKIWQGIKELQEKGEVISVKISGANSGGLVALINDIKAFLPVSQLTTEHYPRVNDGDRGKILEELKKLVGQELKVKIIDFNPRHDKLIISERETASQNIKELLGNYKTGDVVEGIISGVADFGAFMRFTDNPQIEGLIHISELDHRLIESPKEIVKVNDTVKAKILEIKDGRVTLSLKALKTDPWEKVGEKYKADQEIEGRIARFNPFGAFVSLDENIQGLIHVSEFGSVEEMKKQIEEGKSYLFKIDSVKPQEKRIILKLKK